MASQVASRHANLKRVTHTSTCSHFAQPFQRRRRSAGGILSSFSPLISFNDEKKELKRIKMSIHPLRPHPHPVPEHSAAFVKTGLSVSIQNARVTRAHSQISRRNSTLGRTVCDLDRDNRDKHIGVRAIGISLFLKPLVAGFIFT